MSRPLILVATPVPASLQTQLEQACEVINVPRGTRPSDGVDASRAAEVAGLLCNPGVPVDAALMDALPGLKVVSNFAVGYDNIDVAAAQQRDIMVCNTPGVLDAAVADLTIGLLICLSRNLVHGDTYVRDGSWEKLGPPPLMQDVRGKTLGLLGMGRIGREVARLAQAFDLTVYYHNRSRDTDAEASGLAQYLDRDSLFSQSDYLSIHVPHTPETEKSIGKRELGLMKPSAYLINTGRGAVMNEPELIEALKSGQIAGAALDVMAQEPLPADHALCKLPNVILQAHIGSATTETRHAMITLATENLLDALAGRTPKAVVTA